MRLMDILQKGERACVMFVCPQDADRNFCVYFRSPQDKMAQAMEPLIGEMLDIGEPTGDRPFRYAKAIYCFGEDELEEMELNMKGAIGNAEA